MTSDPLPPRVSIHGGHSGEFSSHAKDSLEEVIKQYIAQEFSWVGITEHMPPVDDDFLYADEVEAGLDAEKMRTRFSRYFERARGLQEHHGDQIEIFVGFETETCSGSEAFIRQLISRHSPDYIVGSVHHVNDQPIDISEKEYFHLAGSLGGLESLYCRYFDDQFAMIRALRPAVVGHFDLIRKFDPEYRNNIRSSQVWERVLRNLDLIKDMGLILDLNLRGFDKLGAEPHPTRDILCAAIEREIAIVPGDDSHGVTGVGIHFDRGVEVLRELGADLQWKRPLGPR